MELIENFNNVIRSMWDQLQDEFLVVYHPDGSTLFKIHTFENLMKILGVGSKGHDLYIQPAVIFACLGSNFGAINYDISHNNHFTHTSLIIKKIKLNRYQDWYVKNGTLNLKLRVPEIITSDDKYTFDEIKISRHPQLRRILKDYFRLIDESFNEQKLALRLLELSIINGNYSFEDADELVLLDDFVCQETYLELLPIELRRIIVNMISEDTYVSLKDINKKLNDPVITLAEKITDELKDTQDASIMDLINNAKESGHLNEMIEFIKSDPNSGGNLYTYITSQVGLNNLFDIINNKIKS